MLQWTLNPMHLELKYTWAISRNSSESKTNFIVEVRDEKGLKGIGEIAPNIRYGETLEIIQAFFKEFQTASGGHVINGIPQLSSLLNSLPLPAALRFGIESAYIHYYCALQKKSIGQVLGITPPETVDTCYSIPIMEPEEIQEFFSTNNLSRFKALKLKINKFNGPEAIAALSRLSSKPIYLDPNEAFDHADELLQFMEKVKDYPIAFIEQPMPADCRDDYRYAKPRSLFPLIADESVTDHPDMHDIKEKFHGVNMKLMKAGGYLKGMEILAQARKAGLKTMVGCMVESSLGIASAWQLCQHVDFIDLDGFMIVKNESYHYLSEQNGSLILNKTFPV